MQAAQLGHALIGYVLAQPALAARWHAESNNLVCLSVGDEAALYGLAERLVAARCSVVCFHEPDLSGALTAIAAGPESRAILANEHLALR